MIRVNGELIDPELIQQSFGRIKTEVEQRSEISCCEQDEAFMQQAEDEVVDSILIAQEAEKNYQDLPEEEVKTALEELIKLYREHGASWEMLEEQKEDLRNEVTANLRIERLIKERTSPVTDPSESELLNYYESRSSDYRTNPEVRCLHFIKVQEGGGDLRALLEVMSDLRQRAMGGEDFEAMALAETDKESKEVDLGWFPLDRPSSPFESILFSMNQGEVSPVLSYEQAFHLVKVIDRRGGELPALAEVEDELRTRYLREKRQEALRTLAQELRTDATIENVDPPEA